MAILRLTPGATFEDAYRVVKTLGRGSMGIVYLVEEIAGGAPRALKIMRDIASDARSAQRFARESSVTTHIASEHVARVLASGMHGDFPWLVMEYVDGEHLDAYLERRADSSPVTLETTQRIIAQIFDAAAAAHEANIVHRDLKPENILVVRSAGDADPPNIKVLDFGIAKLLGQSPNDSTAAGLGTPLWTAPEQGTKSRGLTATADVWALGLIVFYVLTKKVYWKNAQPPSDVLALIVEIARGKLSPASERAEELGCKGALPRGFDAWFGRCVVRDPTARFPNARAAFKELAPLLGNRRRKLVIAAVVGALVILVTAAVFLAARR